MTKLFPSGSILHLGALIVLGFLVALLAAPQIWMGDPDPAQAQDPPLPTVSIEADASAREGEDLIFTARLSAAATSRMTVHYVVSTEAGDTVPAKLPGFDSQQRLSTGEIIVSPNRRDDLRHYVSIEQGETEASFTIQTLDDNVVEGEETFTVTLEYFVPSNVAQLGDAAAIAATGTITDNDHPPTHVSLSLDQPAVAESGGRQTVVVTAAIESCTYYASDQNVILSLNPATAGNADYTAGSLPAITIPAGQYRGEAEFAITPVDDGPGEGDETVTISGRLGSATVMPAVLSISEGPTISIADADAAEGAALAFSVTLSQAASDAISVNYAASVQPGDTASESDFAVAKGRLTFAPGQTTRQITVRAVDDNVDEDDNTAETFTVTLSNPVGGAVLKDPVAVGSITDNDRTPTTIALSLSPAVIGETGGSLEVFQDVVVHATVQGATTFGEDKMIWVTTAPGTATSGTGSEDYLATSDRWIPPITIRAGESRGETNFRISARDDGAGDAGETVIVSGSLAGITVSNATLTITEYTHTLTPAGAAGLEGSTLRLSVSLNSARTTTTTVDYTTSVETSDTAEAGDFSPASGTLTFAANETNKFIDIVTHHDSDATDETFSVIFSNPSANVALANPSAGRQRVIATIYDDESALSFRQSIYTHVAYAGAAVSFTVPSAYNTSDTGATYSATVSPSSNYGLTFTPGSRTISGTLNANAVAGAVIRYTVTANSTSDRPSGSTTVVIMVIDDVCSGASTWRPAGTPSAGLVRDCNILLAAKDTLRGSETLNWATTVSMAQWDGVTVTSGRVSALVLEGGGFYPTVPALNGRIPAVLGGLDELTRLVMDELRLTGQIPPELGGLSNLTHLELDQAGLLTGGIPPELGSLLGLQELKIQRMPLGGTIPPELGSLISAHTLRLRNLQLTGSIPSELGNLPFLQQLSLGNLSKGETIPAGPGDEIQYRNMLSGPLPAWLGDIAALTELELNYNNFSGPIPEELGKLSKVSNLNLDGNRLTGPLPPGLTGVGSDTARYILKLRGNMLTSPAALSATPDYIFEDDGTILVKVKVSVTDPATKFANSFFRNLPVASGMVTPHHRGGVPAAIATGPQASPPCNAFSLDPLPAWDVDDAGPVHDEEHEIAFIITPTDDDGVTDDGRFTFNLQGTTVAGTTLVASPVSIFIGDNDIPPPGSPGVNVSTGALFISEDGGVGSYYVWLEERPSAPVTISVSSSNTGAATVNTATLTFNTNNWNQRQVVSVTASDDNAVNAGDRRVTISHSASGGGYDGVPISSVSITLQDDDGVSVSSTALTVGEAGGVGTYSVWLNKRPTSPVVITVSSSDTGAATVSPASLTFTPSNYGLSQTVTVTGVDDNAVNVGDRRVTISHSASGGIHDGVPVPSVSVTVQDDDVLPAASRGVNVSPTDLTVNEAGGVGTYGMWLNSRPTGTVTISVSSSDTRVATVSPASLTFTTDNWSELQRVSVTGVNDDVSNEGDRRAAISHSASGGGYGGVSVRSVSVRVLDDDAPVNATPPSNLAIDGKGQITWRASSVKVPNQRYEIRWALGDGPPRLHELCNTPPPEGQKPFQCGVAVFPESELCTDGLCRHPISDFDANKHHAVRVRTMEREPTETWVYSRYSPE